MKTHLSGVALLTSLLFISGAIFAQVEMTGEMKQWHKITLTFNGPETSETDTFNPFFNYRLNVIFNHPSSGKSYRVPGYFAADGNAANSGTSEGNKWRVHFAPDETGSWTWKADFRTGEWVAVSEKDNSGEEGGFMNGMTGAFEILPSDKSGRDFRGRGRLEYVGGTCLRFAGSGEYFLKCGADAPENFLAYADFDGTFHNDGHKDSLVKTWEPHVKDWKKGDPVWKGDKGKGMIGALNYLASEGMNAFSFLTMNIIGDDQNVFPYIDYDTYDRFDVSKLDQWEIVFEHADKLGMFLHFKTQETENQGLLDNGGLGAFRRLYYRELIARFGHHLAMNWNMGEEIGEIGQINKTPPQFKIQRLAMAQYFYDHDPYRHHVVIHNGAPFYDILGPESKYTGISLQTNRTTFERVHSQVLYWRNLSIEAGKPLAISVDEPGDAQHALVPDSDDPGHDLARQNGLWGAYTAGAWGVEWYFGYKHDHSDLTCQDFRSRDLFWDQCRYALEFFADNEIPFWEMEPSDELTSNGFCMTSPEKAYVIFIPSGGTSDIYIGEDEYDILWYNPREGGALQKGTVLSITGTGKWNIGNAPADPDKDWVAFLVNRKTFSESDN